MPTQPTWFGCHLNSVLAPEPTTVQVDKHHYASLVKFPFLASLSKSPALLHKYQAITTFAFHFDNLLHSPSPLSARCLCDGAPAVLGLLASALKFITLYIAALIATLAPFNRLANQLFSCWTLIIMMLIGKGPSCSLVVVEL